MIETRRARLQEACALLGLLRALPGELGAWAPPAEGLAALRGIKATLDRGAVFVAEEGGELRGSLGIEAGELWWSGAPCLADVWFYVAPAWRQSGAGTRLVGMARDYARGLGVPMMLGRIGGDDPSADRWYRMQGGRPIGGVFLFN